MNAAGMNKLRNRLLSCPDWLFDCLYALGCLLPPVKRNIAFLKPYRLFTQSPARFDAWVDEVVRRDRWYVVRKLHWCDNKVDVAFINFAIGMILSCLCQGRIPVFQVACKHDGSNLWEQLFEQPFGLPDAGVSGQQTADCPFTECFPSSAPDYQTVYDPEKLRFFSHLYAKYLRLNPRAAAFVEAQAKAVFHDGAPLAGVKVRGTDFVKLKLTGLPVQPELDTVLSDTARLLEEQSLCGVLLVTEEEAIAKRFNAAFPGRIRMCEGEFYDSAYISSGNKWIGEIHFDRENDIARQALEYIGSLELLSRTQALLGGNCGATLYALIRNGGAYRDTLIYRLGVY